MDWRHNAVCREEDPELFFPIGNTGPALLQIEEAKAVCRRCPVMDQCLQWALESGQEVSTVEGEGGLSTLIWFGDHLLVVLQVKDALVSGPELAQELVDFQQTRPEWAPLPELYAPV